MPIRPYEGAVAFDLRDDLRRALGECALRNTSNLGLVEPLKDHPKPLVVKLTIRDFDADDRGQAVKSHLDLPLEDWDGYVGRLIFLVRPTCYKLQTFTRINR